MVLKRVFPVIIILITLSVLGILFIQMSWIQNAIFVKKEQYQKDLDNATRQIKEAINSRFIQEVRRNTGRIFLSEQDEQFYLDNNFTSQIFTEEDIRQIIDKSLTHNKIHQPFEFGITNIFRYPILTSKGFKMEDLPQAQHVPLTSDNAYAQEILHLIISEPKNYIVSRMGWMIVASVIFTTIMVSAFVVTLRTLLNQKKVSEIKSDFINNMTHELKTPLATISLAVDALNNEKVVNKPDQIRYYSGMIKEENKRMNQQVETILQAARIERQELQLKKKRLDAHEVIRMVANNLTLLIQEKNGLLSLRMLAAKATIDADPVHFSNIVFNLLDNAIKYSKEDLRIEITTQNSGNKLLIRIKDNGIGMNKETQARVFEKFYRAHTGNIHDVKGFGLGLSYVKAIAEAHHGTVKVESALGKGSTFTLALPLATGPEPVESND